MKTCSAGFFKAIAGAGFLTGKNRLPLHDFVTFRNRFPANKPCLREC
ncbi:hypothetical protein B4099_0191 [Heyndrickxia coagulans]|uniref:Uncharacterized protein n=1 Tax=Heyndrickxia coagulans TaxID=1398 RepID=A0A150K594_HEYCO|nr:hypothetical protein B4099_0191 [Heyndrickxia coagulans]